MCGRYRLFAGEMNPKMQRIIDMCNAEGREWIDVKPSGEVSPGDLAPALIIRDGKVSAASMRWGFAGTNGALVINARSEDVHNRQMFRDLVKEKRCVLMSAGYYEWRRGDGQRYLISGGEVVYLAGLYNVDENGRRNFVVLTRAAYGAHAKVHRRMPVVLSTREKARAWLSGRLSALQASMEEGGDLSIEALGGEQVQMDFDLFLD